jgi:hypothetical protein
MSTDKMRRTNYDSSSVALLQLPTVDNAGTTSATLCSADETPSHTTEIRNFT